MEKPQTDKINLTVVTEEHEPYAQQISDLYRESARQRGIGIANRPPEYIIDKMQKHNGIIALHEDGRLAGFCYIETWGHGKYVANSGLIVVPAFRKQGLAKRIKKKVFNLSRDKFPDAKIFGITTSAAVMKINSDLGYRPVTFSELTDDDKFWNGCSSCPNYEILNKNDRKHCLCTGMLFDPDDKRTPDEDDDED
ncbi:MAG: GNAT family N-acetyltransferase [Candidatus Marinimicrobia bacterium]|nr:GNAT family N-acetyltransferase [Candidatus Neomarinimicrobiota bacterium]